nr:hypothetical protein MACL_00001415 [Theileria orientalis]
MKHWNLRKGYVQVIWKIGL